MGNEISHKRYWCRKSGKFERLGTVQDNAGADLPTAPGAVLWSCENRPSEETEATATGMQDKDVGRESEISSSSLSVTQIMVKSTELRDLGEAQPSAEQREESENKPTMMVSPERPTCAPAQDRPAAAQQARGDTGVTTTDLPLQAAIETGAGDAEDAVTDQPTVESNSALRRRPRDKLCKPSPLCRWLKRLKSPAVKAKAKPDVTTIQE